MTSKFLTRVLAITAVALALIGGVAGTPKAMAQGPRLQTSSQPLLGFTAHMEYGWGLQVDHVHYGSAAHRLGLEPGDVVVKVNNTPIRSLNDYYRAVRYSGGRVRLLVDDINGRGLIWTRPAYLNNGQGPNVAASQAP